LGRDVAEPKKREREREIFLLPGQCEVWQAKKVKEKKREAKKKEEASIISIFKVFEIQSLPALKDCVHGQISRRQFVGSKNLIICAKFKINLN